MKPTTAREELEAWASADSYAELVGVRGRFPVGTEVRIKGSNLWPAKDRVLNGLRGTVADVYFTGDYNVSVRVKFHPNKHGRKWAEINFSWLEPIGVLEQLAEVGR